MKYMRFLAIILAILAVLIISMPVSANTTTSNYTVNGVEIFAGIDYHGDNYGATFVAQATGTDNNGILRASINYRGTDPHTPSNDIFGGNWTLTVTKYGKALGTIIGVVNNGGSVSWGNTNTDIGHVQIGLTIIGGTDTFKRIKGYGSFDGYDDHINGPKIGNLTVPIVYSTGPGGSGSGLSLTY